MEIRPSSAAKGPAEGAQDDLGPIPDEGQRVTACTVEGPLPVSPLEARYGSLSAPFS